MKFTTIADAKRQTGLTSFGKVNNGAKHKKAYKYNEMVYTIYLAPAKLSGYEVCPGRSIGCTKACLNMSGMNTMSMRDEYINKSRIKKTRLFMEQREFTVRWIMEEIKNAKKNALLKGMDFSIRLNNTSDISPEEFYIMEGDNKFNLLELFPDVNFYDYTKVPERVELLKKYPNYDLTFSYNGENMDICKTMLENNVRVAMVFNKKVPNVFIGYNVVDADRYDMRYKDPRNVIAGLKYKRVRNKLESSNTFVIHEE